jgi:hypothetical protein
MLVSNTWNLEGEDFSRFPLQYFANYDLSDGWYLTSSPIITADWEVNGYDWTVPVGGGFGKVHRLGKLPVNLQFQAFYNAEKPKFGADWSTRFQILFLFPKSGGCSASARGVIMIWSCRSLLLLLAPLVSTVATVTPGPGSTRRLRLLPPGRAGFAPAG